MNRIRSAKGTGRALLRACRPHQWLKNLLLFVPLLTSHRIFEVGLAADVLLAAVLFSFCASGLYVINDVFDVRYDRKHPYKLRRPIAAGMLAPRSGVALACGLIVIGLGGSYFLLPEAFTITISMYVILSFAYTIYLKRVVVLDVIVLAAFYALRVIAGGTAVHVEISNWLLAFSIFLFLSLAFLKRYAELNLRTDDSSRVLSGRSYRSDDADLIRSLGPASGYLSVLVLVLYIHNSEYAPLLYEHPTVLWLLGPCLLYWITHIWLTAHRGEMHDDPLVFTMKDPASYWVAVVVAVVVFFAV